MVLQGQAVCPLAGECGGPARRQPEAGQGPPLVALGGREEVAPLYTTVALLAPPVAGLTWRRGKQWHPSWRQVTASNNNNNNNNNNSSITIVRPLLRVRL